MGVVTDRAVTYGVAGDIPVPADYNGDLLADIAVFRPGQVSRWFLDTDRNGITNKMINYGTWNDIPLEAELWVLDAMGILP